MSRPTEPRSGESGILAIPDLSLVVLIGASGSGKSTFAARHFETFESVSSDYCRGLISNDPGDQSSTFAAFSLLGEIVGRRLDRGLLTVVDATSVQPRDRAELIDLARKHHVLPVAIVIDPGLDVCFERNALRPEAPAEGPSPLGSRVPEHVVRRQQLALDKSRRGLEKEGFRRVYRVGDNTDVSVVREPLLTDRKGETGPFDIIGDVHGCLPDLERLLEKLEYTIIRDAKGRPVDAVHPDRRAIFVGDLIDRGPDSPGVLRLVMGMHAAGHALAVPGNHEAKLVRALDGAKVSVGHGLAGTLEQLESESPEFRRQVRDWCESLVSHLVLDGGALVVAHAGLKESFHNRSSGAVRSFALYGDVSGEIDEHGFPVRYPWADDYRGKATVVYGHTPVARPEWVNNTLCVDTGAVFGGSLTALRYPERETVSVAAEQAWAEPSPMFAAELESFSPANRSVRVQDVLGRRIIATNRFGTVRLAEEDALGALETMGRFALPPEWLPYLPPTMSPTETYSGTAAEASGTDFLEHPDTAFAFYRDHGVRTVLCEEKHMGSRTVVLVCRDAAAAARRFGADGRTGAIYTRTGREFFAHGTVAAGTAGSAGLSARTATLASAGGSRPPLAGGLGEQLLARVRSAAEVIGLFDELGSDWLLLDTELLPWSAKADTLIRDQYASVAAAGDSGTAAALDALRRAEERLTVAGAGTDGTRALFDLAGSVDTSRHNLLAMADAYRQYVAPVDGLDGIRLAVFQVLAAEGATFETRDHAWHLDVADRLVAVDKATFAPTARLEVDTHDPESWAAGVRWWLDLTEAGGEGMVVKPSANLTFLTRRGGDGERAETNRAVQPGLKVRGREYLRMIYGPDYLEPANLSRLKSRNLGHKRSMASREYSLGLEALERMVAREPLWRVHEAVFATLALESEAVDPRL